MDVVEEARCHDMDRGLIPLAPAQRRLWLDLAKRGRVARDSGLLSTITLRLSGAVNPHWLRLACAHVAAQHPALRVRLVDIGRELPVQRVVEEPAAAFTWRVEPAGRFDSAADLAAEMLRASMTLVDAPLSAVSLARLSDQTWAFVWTSHHIVVDGWSLDTIVRDLGDAYRGLASGSTNPAVAADLSTERYASTCVALNGQEHSADGVHRARYWQDALRDFVPAPGRLGRATGTGETVSVPLPKRAALRIHEPDRAAIADLAMTLGTSSLACLVFAYVLAISRRFGVSDVVVAVPTFSRGIDDESIVGCFANVLPVRCRLDERLSFRLAIDAFSEAYFEAISHQLPYEFVMRSLPGGESSVRFAVSPRELPAAPTSWADVEVERQFGVLGDEMHFPVVIEIAMDGQQPVDVSVSGHAAAWPATELDDFLAQVVGLAVTGARSPDTVLLELDGVSRPRPVEVQAPDADPADIDRLLRRLTTYGDAPALSSDRELWSFRQLVTSANAVGARLAESGVRHGDRVAVVMERGPWLVAAALGTMSIGAVYMPCDPTDPARARAALSSTSWTRLVSDTAERDGLPPADVVVGGAPMAHLYTTVSHRPHNSHGPAYVIHTSGSTGVPKAVEVTHRALLRTVADAVSLAGLSAADVVSAHSSASFDASLFEWLPILSVGGRLALMPDAVRTDPARVWDWAAAEGVTVILLTTSLLTRALETVPAGHPTLRLLQTGAEAMHGAPPPVPCPLMNIYGPTEGTIAATAGMLTDDRPHIGNALPRAAVYLLDAWLRPVRDGEIGQIYIGGGREARGYVGAPGETARAFIADPYGRPGARMYVSGDYAVRCPDGMLLYQGREDGQVKIRGVRLELAEIQGALEAHPSVRAAACVVVTTGRQPAVHGFYTGEEIPSRQLREFLLGRLPRAGVPGSLMHLDALPLNVNGKVDAQALRRLAMRSSLPTGLSGAAEPVAGKGNAVGVRGVVREIWSAELGVDDVRPDDDFFEQGGDSFIAARMCAGIADRLSVRVPLAAVFTAPTFAELVTLVDDKVAAGGAGEGSA